MTFNRCVRRTCDPVSPLRYCHTLTVFARLVRVSHGRLPLAAWAHKAHKTSSRSPLSLLDTRCLSPACHGHGGPPCPRSRWSSSCTVHVIESPPRTLRIHVGSRVAQVFSYRAVGVRVRGARGGCAGGHRPTRAAARSGGMAATKRGAVPKPWEGQERPSELKETCTGFSWTVNTDVETDTAIESEMSQSAERDAKLPRREEYVTMDAL